MITSIKQTEFITLGARETRARVTHDCDGCEKSIWKSNWYHRVVIKKEGKVETKRFHCACYGYIEYL
jgi:hypothetical protein